jgi:hypothetical protein
MKKIVTVVVCGLGIAVGASALASEAAGDQMEAKIRKTAIGVGNAWACTDKDKREMFREEAHQLFDLILQDVGTDLAFVYAASLGYGSAQPKENLDCSALLEQWEGIREDYKLKVDM